MRTVPTCRPVGRQRTSFRNRRARRVMFAASAVLTIVSAVSAATAAAADPPNIVVVLADDLGWADSGCYGNRFNETPRIDRLAREGMRFTQFYAGPVCSPTRANLQSGQDQARFGITQHIPGHRRPFARLTDPAVPRQLPSEVETFAERLSAAGYRSGYFGKWHLGGNGFGPEDQGWQTALECQRNVLPPAVTGEDGPRRTAEFLTEKAIEFIETDDDRPFLLQVSHFAVHIPLSTTPDLLSKYEAKEPVDGYPSLPAYAGLMEELDQSLGQIVDAIDRSGLGERTLVLFVSDNGGLEHEQSGRVVTSNEPLRGEKGQLYEGGIRVPAIARWVGEIPEGQVCDTPAITFDLYPTFVELAGGLPPADQPVDGVSLAGLFRDPDASLGRDTLRWHLPHYHHSTPAGAIRRGDWKLIEFFEDGRLELYNLEDDLGERHDRSGDKPGLARELRESLAAWRQRIDAKMPVANPDHDPDRETELHRPRRRR